MSMQQQVQAASSTSDTISKTAAVSGVPWSCSPQCLACSMPGTTSHAPCPRSSAVAEKVRTVLGTAAPIRQHEHPRCACQCSRLSCCC